MFDQTLLREHWQKYVMEGTREVPSRPLVTRAWDRCLAMGVDPQDGIGRVLDGASLERRLAKNHRLIEIARPIMSNLYETIKKTSYSIILTDSEGVLLHVLENNNIEAKHKNLNFVAGTYWNERNVGSNAIGTALAIDRPVQMVGAEHFCVTHHGWTCSAAPIHDEMGQVIGCLDFSGRVEDVQTHTFGMVTTAAEIIEKQWALENSRELMDTAFNAILDGMIILDGRRQITFVNRKMREILFGASEASVEGLTVEAIFPGLDLELPVFTEHRALRYADYSFHFRGKKIDCLLNIAPILAEDRVSGAVIYVKEAHQVRRVVNQIAGYRATFTFRDILTEDPQMKQIITFAKRIAVTDATVLIQGESGTGKELFAQAIHSRSPRHREPFIAINCAALPRDLVESELFGYEKGSFTGAVKEGKPGKFELADGGTLFLDEIGELPLDLQSKLLRFLDDQTVTRIGGTHERLLNVRVLAATNRDLLEEVKHRTFREDLYYRLNVINLVIPPLRERRADILPLATAYLDRLNRGWTGEEKSLSESLVEELLGADWPGNVRELHNAIHRAFYASTQPLIGLPTRRRQADRREESRNGASLETVERLALIDALDSTGGDVLEAARTLSIGKSTVYRKIKSYAIDLSRFRQ